MTYAEEALQVNLSVDESCNDQELNRLMVERDFMVSCLENNIILEADDVVTTNNKKRSWWEIIKTAILNFFKKFLGIMKNFEEDQGAWIKQNKSKFDSFKYDNFRVDLIPYWEKKFKSDIYKPLKEMTIAVANIKLGNPKIKNLQTAEQVENSPDLPFKKFKGNLSFNDACKVKFIPMTDKKENKIKTYTETDGNELKKDCINNMIPYVDGYGASVINALKVTKGDIDKILDSASKITNIIINKESYCLLEEALYSDTELKYCLNYDMVFEDTSNGAETKTTLGAVKPSDNGSGSTGITAQREDEEKQRLTNEKSELKKKEKNLKTRLTNLKNQNSDGSKDSEIENTNKSLADIQTKINDVDESINKLKPDSEQHNETSNNAASQEKDEEKPKTQDNTQINEYDTFCRESLKLIQYAFATALSVCQNTYTQYVKTLLGIAKNNGVKNFKQTDSTEPNKQETVKKKRNKKKTDENKPDENKTNDESK